ncbi:tonB-system energizer ExbB [Starkeya sp. ORNL1]|uniref:tonB-system energizer ExbB n=1 Tax=Starkeya sp. ORNL1 TaxID=2709380 RepID=UPI0014648CC4|nr:tonB-system energizer ExbB [Starkeya sp. ORNL1]QJP13868.1 tonB-system energizer ExbB [Starkeya sp. ORNL1]
MPTLRRRSLRSRLPALLAALVLALPAPALAQETAPPAATAAPTPTPATPTPELFAPAPAAQSPAPVTQAAPQPAAPTPEAPHDVTPTDDAAVNATLPHDLSPWGMFMAADWIVKGVMIGLAFASVVTWTVWLAKSLELLVVTGKLRRQLRILLGSASLDAARAGIGDVSGATGAMVRTTDLELGRSGALPAEGIKERVAISLSRIEAAAGRRITRGTGLLATIGATAPFVGLFGTVWGIMNSFIGISKAQTTNLAVVAPGIAEALLATAIGLVAAIPAVVIYNHFTRQVLGYRALLGDASAEMLRLLSRDLDRRDAGQHDYAQPPTKRVRAAAE